MIITLLVVLMYVPYIIAWILQLLCGVLQIISQAIITTFVECPGGVRFYCVAWRVPCAYSGRQHHTKRKKQIKFSDSPPPQMKTLKTRKVLLYRAALCSSVGRSRKLFSEFKFSYIGKTGGENFCS